MTPILATIDPYILAFSAVTVFVTIFMGFWSAKKSKTASDFFVAGRSVSVGWNASAISGEYLSAASFMGVAGMVMSSGYDALWYPVCYACGYLFLLLFIAGPLRRFGAYTIPDFAEGRFDSPLFRKIAVCFVLFIGFFYTMPQMKGAGTTLAYIFPGLPYWAGVVLVGAVITLNVALGGMKGITLVQAFQYWAKMFAISVPIFVLMAVYGHYGKQLGANGDAVSLVSLSEQSVAARDFDPMAYPGEFQEEVYRRMFKDSLEKLEAKAAGLGWIRPSDLIRGPSYDTTSAMANYADHRMSLNDWCTNYYDQSLLNARLTKLDTTSLPPSTNLVNASVFRGYLKALFSTNGMSIVEFGKDKIALVMTTNLSKFKLTPTSNSLESELALGRRVLPEKAPADSTWLSPFGPLTTKAAKAAAAAIPKSANAQANTNLRDSRFRLYLPPYVIDSWKPPQNQWKPQGLLPFVKHVLGMDYHVILTIPGMTNLPVEVAFQTIAMAKKWEVIRIEDWGKTFVKPPITNGYAGPTIRALIRQLKLDGIEFEHVDGNRYLPVRRSRSAEYPPVMDLLRQLKLAAESTPDAWLAKHEKPLALLYTYSLIIALVCGTAGLPHILVRFYTNPDGVAAKRTTMWVMILIGIFYVFPPVFGVMGRNLFPELYSGIGAKGTDKIVLELPRLLNEKYAPLGSILSGITCAGAFAAFMSTFSGLLVSMTGAMAHDVYGRMLRPKSTPDQRMKMFKVFAVVLGGVAVLLGSFVEPLEINFMVGQAFAIAAASYFPLLFMAVWWRKLTMKGAAVGMLTGGVSAMVAISLTSFSTLSVAPGKTGELFAMFKPLNDFWATQPLLRILCEQPALWAVPLAIGLMIVVSKLTAKEVPADIRMKMLVLHAPEKLGLKQEYIQEHQHGH